MILILTDDSDPHADLVERKLRQRGAEFFRFDPKKFPSSAELSVGYSSTGRLRCALSMGDDQIDFSRVQSVWYRRPNASVAHPAITDKLTRNYIEEECRFFTNDIWNMVECLWVPAPPPVIAKAALKALQLNRAHRSVSNYLRRYLRTAQKNFWISIASTTATSLASF